MKISVWTKYKRTNERGQELNNIVLSKNKEPERVKKTHTHNMHNQNQRKRKETDVF